MGDSYIALSGDFTTILQDNARQAGALGAREAYIDRAASGAAMENALIKIAQPIPTQLPQVLRDSRRLGPEGLKLIIMTGGGNDVLINHMECRALTSVTDGCKAVVANTLMIMKKLFADMKAGGIKEVIYFWYPDLDINTDKVINDYSIPLAKEACESNADVRFHFVDTREPFRGHPEYISALDGIHPTRPGSKVIADLVWNVMEENCLAAK
jgi:lysophospholipase L1-like esterase